MSIRNLTNEDLITYVRTHVSGERAYKAHVLRGLAEIHRRNLYAVTGSSNVWDALLHEHGYSEPTAYRRSPLVKMLARLSETWEELILGMIATGELKLGHLALFAEHIFNETAAELVPLIPGKKMRELEFIIAQRFPAKRHKPRKNRTRKVVITPEPGVSFASSSAHDFATKNSEPLWTTPAEIPEGKMAVGLEVRKTFIGASLERLERLQELYPDKTIEQILDDAIEDSFKKREPALRGRREAPADKKVEEPAKKLKGRDHISAVTRAKVYQRDNGQCAFVSSEGRRCQARGRLEVDHITPVARGGGNHVDNLRMLCRSHNQFVADAVFGKGFMDRKRQGRPR